MTRRGYQAMTIKDGDAKQLDCIMKKLGLDTRPQAVRKLIKHYEKTKGVCI